jgi:hypothetical protein
MPREPVERPVNSSASSLRQGAWCGALVALASAAEMLALNRRTINPVSAVVVSVVWAAAGGALGALLGVLGARGAAIFRRREDDAAGFLATIGVGHLLLPLGFGPSLALASLGARLARRALWPRRRRLDIGIFLALVALAADRAMPGSLSLAPDLDRAQALARDVPSPGSLPVTLTIHPPSAFPEVPAVHVRLRRLRSDPRGQRAALLTGRLPARTNAGPHGPHAVPGGGGLSRIPARFGTSRLAAVFPVVRRLEGTAFDPAGTLPDLARSAGVPVLDSMDGAAPLFLRVLALDAAPTPELARLLAAEGAWLDVAIDETGAAELALAGRGVSGIPVDTEATLLDVTPTALHLLGLAVPRDVDGRVLLERLDPTGPGARPPRYRALASAGAASSRARPASDATTSR